MIGCVYCDRERDGESMFCAACAERWAFVRGIVERMAIPRRTLLHDRVKISAGAVETRKKGSLEQQHAYLVVGGQRVGEVTALRAIRDEVSVPVTGLQSPLVVEVEIDGINTISHFEDDLPDIELVWESVP